MASRSPTQRRNGSYSILIANNMSAIIDDYLVKEVEWNGRLTKEHFLLTNAPDSIKEAVSFLVDKISFRYASTFSANPFEPSLILNGKRTYDVSDLTEEDLSIIKNLIASVQNPLIKGKLYDIIGVRENSRNASLTCASLYWDYFASNIESERIPFGCMNRALYLFSKYDKKALRTSFEHIFSHEFLGVATQFKAYYHVCKYMNMNSYNLTRDQVIKIIDTIKQCDNTDMCALSMISTVLNQEKCPTEEKHFLRNKYADICEQITDMSNYSFDCLETAIQILDDKEDADRKNELRFKLDNIKEQIYNKMTPRDVPLDQKTTHDINNIVSNYSSELSCCNNNLSKLLLLQQSTCPIDYNAIEMNSPLPFFNVIHLDDNKKVVYDSRTANDKEKGEYLLAKKIDLHLSLNHMLYDVFFKTFKYDDTVSQALDEILSKNALVPKQSISYIKENLALGLSDISSIKKAVYALIPHLENGLRYYLKNYKKIYPTIKMGKGEVEAGLNHMLANTENNKFRMPIEELLGEKLLFNLYELLYNKVLGDIRNRNYHDGIDNASPSHIGIALFFYILNAFCKGCDPSL